MRASQVLTVQQGGQDQAAQLGFTAFSAHVDNFTNQYLTVRGSSVVVPPYTYGAVITLPSGTQVGEVSLSSAVGTPAPVALPGTFAQVTFYDQLLTPTPGVSLQPTQITVQSGTITIGSGTINVQNVPNGQLGVNSPQQLLGPMNAIPGGATSNFNVPSSTHCVAVVGPGNFLTQLSITGLTSNTSYAKYQSTDPQLQSPNALLVIVPISSVADNQIQVKLFGNGTYYVVAILDTSAVRVTTDSYNPVYDDVIDRNVRRLGHLAATTSRSAAIMSGPVGAWTLMVAANPTRQGIFVINNTNGDAYLNFDAGATQPFAALHASTSDRLSVDHCTTAAIYGFINVVAGGTWGGLGAGLYVVETYS